ncbi:2-oxo-4-hydroxy-4-carboxy-5-ureidoimidazoline decarboxylase [Georgenia sp. MJ173]|uniref:2-oxo-4-hydroxy-4-carboxy-5-ureidoimidazoline decarboxylase n=1 Tax=Georgenia sunbinii TaxID=3117728 RepID=UPI002F26A761
MTSGLASFNAASDDAARRLLLTCVDVPRWAAELATGRPYTDVGTLLAAARTAADPWTDEEVDAAAARHPRVGEPPAGDDAGAAHSRREQAAVDATTAERLRAANRAYEDRFGHVFLIRAAGRGGDEILAALEHRLGNDPATEHRITADQLREIAVRRLQEELA